MKNNKYTKEFKKTVVDRFNNGEKPADLAKEFGIKSVMSIYNWKNSFDKQTINGKSLKKDLDQLSQKATKEVVEDFYKKENQILKKKLAEANKNAEDSRLEAEFLKKLIWFEKLERISPFSKKRISNQKYIKNECYKVIEEYKGVYSIRQMCRILPVSNKSYLAWIKRGKKSIISKTDDKKDTLISQALEKHYDQGGLYLGAVKLQKILANMGVFGGINKIRKMNYLLKGKKVFHNRTGSRKIGRDKHEQNIRPDLIKNNYKTRRSKEKLGMDATILKVKINGQNKKIVIELIFDWHTKAVIAYSWNYSEDAQAVISVLEQAKIYLKDNDIKAIIQCDRGRANCSKVVREFEMKTNFTISMSESGFKHNAPTESLNGWFKEYFRFTHSLQFGDIEEFEIKLNSFVSKYNEAIFLNDYQNLSKYKIEGKRTAYLN